MKNIQLYLCVAIFFLLPIMARSATDTAITVQVTGEGNSKTEALEDALRMAVRKVVGTYVVTQSELKEEDFDESIYVNADAVVTQHKEIKTEEKDGIISLTIEATVVKNDLLKYIAKNESTQITSTDLGNLLNRRNAMATAEKSLDYIFKDYAQQIYQAKKSGDFSLADEDDVGNDTVSIEMPFELRFNENAYQKFEQRLKNLLAKIAVAQTFGTTEEYDNIYGYNGIFSKFINESSQWPTGTKPIVFVTELMQGQSKKLNYHFFAVPNQVYQKIHNFTDDFCVIVFEFQLADRDQPLKGYRKLKNSFFFTDIHGSIWTLEFRNWMCIITKDNNGNDKPYNTSAHEFKTVWKFSEDQIRALKSCTLKIYTGQQAKYLWYTSAERSEYEIEKLANQGYLPAMIALAEQFGEKDWYHNAALMGSRYARQKIAWNNGGLGFEIRSTREGFMVWAAQKGSPVKKGMILKSINETEVPKSANELSKLIGAFSPDESVNVEFTNGKKFDLSVQVP